MDPDLGPESYHLYSEHVSERGPKTILSLGARDEAVLAFKSIRPPLTELENDEDFEKIVWIGARNADGSVQPVFHTFRNFTPTFLQFAIRINEYPVTRDRDDLSDNESRF